MIDKIRRLIFHKVANSHLRTSENKMLASCEANALKAFHHAVKTTPFYRKFLEKKKADWQGIETIKDFKQKIPLMDKAATFIRHKDSISSLCQSESLSKVGGILSSSGTSGDFSYGLLSSEDIKLGPEFVDFGLDLNFGIFNKRTLLINCLPMGVKVPSNHAVVADVSVRKDMALSLVTGFGRDFDLIIMVGENSFIKEVLEFGIQMGIDWSAYDVRIVIGEEGFPENFRTYLASILGYEVPLTDKLIIGSSMGISELGLTVFQENQYTIRLRQFIDEDEAVRSALFGSQCKLCPMIFVYYPMNIFLEEDKSAGNPDHVGNDLIFTKLDTKSIIPLIRYASGDRGRILKHSQMASLLRQHNRSDLIPNIELPFVAVFERGKLIISDGEYILSEGIKAGIYSDWTLPERFTGNFKVSKNDDNVALVEIQLKEGVAPEPALESAFTDAICRFNKGKILVQLYQYESFPYPLNYERKFKYID